MQTSPETCVHYDITTHARRVLCGFDAPMRTSSRDLVLVDCPDCLRIRRIQERAYASAEAWSSDGHRMPGEASPLEGLITGMSDEEAAIFREAFAARLGRPKKPSSAC